MVGSTYGYMYVYNHVLMHDDKHVYKDTKISDINVTSMYDYMHVYKDV